MPNGPKRIITISRQLASGGAYIGHSVARRLGYKYVEREVLYLAARDLGVDIREISKQDETKSGFVDNLMKSFYFGSPYASYTPPAGLPVYDADLYEAESRIIKRIAESYSAVIVGHAGFSVLAGLPGALHIYIYASKNFRVARLRQFHSVSEEQALAEIGESDRRREEYLKSRTGKLWHDARNYHLCLDTEAAGIEQAVDLITAMAIR